MGDARHLRSSLVASARRYGCAPHEAEDVAHDILLSALRRSGALEALAVRGAARRHVAFVARTASRRRERERAYGRLRPGAEREAAASTGTPLTSLSPALRTTVLLLLAELDKAELRVVLGISDAALRKRFQALRARGPFTRPASAVHPADPRRRHAQVDLLPRLARRAPSPRVLGVRDPDGHGIIFSQALTSATAAATGVEPCSTDRSKTSPSSSSSPT
ncbi:MAG: hypothetical protein AAGA54_33880 [Myxococcota bacterium]